MSVLEDLTKGIMNPKADKAHRLTPVGGEATTTVAQLAAGLPNDLGMLMSNESLHQAAIDLRAHAAVMLTVADAIDKLTGEAPFWTHPSEPEPGAKPTKAQKEAAKATYEKESDARVKAKASPEAVAAMMQPIITDITALDDGATEEPEAPQPAATGDWTCPDHGATSLVKLTSRSKREYLACDVRGCDEFDTGK